MKFLVLGCNGMAGHMACTYLHEKGHDVLGFDRAKSAYVRSIKGNAQNLPLVTKLIRDGKLDAVVNCIGVLNRFAEQNKARAVFLNAYFPHFLSSITENLNTQVIQISTDCVFSGKRGGYTEDDFPDGESFYGRTKALGELNDGKNLTLRTSLIGPDIRPEGIGLLNWFMRQSGEIQGYTKAIWTGQTTLQLAKTIETAAKEKAHGLCHAVPDLCISKYDLLRKMNHFLRGDQVRVLPVDGTYADKSLKRTRFALAFGIPNYDAMIFELAKWMQAHAFMYPHYLGKGGAL